MLSTEQIQKCIVWACEHEVAAPKPGNVNCFSDAHNMQLQDFINSAHAIAPALSVPNSNVGQMILDAIIATRTVVDCNTNLGIVLLFAPLCCAIQNCDSFEQLPQKLDHVLNNLTIKDAIDTYQAIRLAQAGGLGHSEQQDINNTPTVTLRQAMAIARNHDAIAAQYLNNYHEIYTIGLAKLTESLNCGESVEWATTFAYLNLLSNVPDSLIYRKYGLERAHEVMKFAKQLLRYPLQFKGISRIERDIIKWDIELKKEAINPGTTADLTAATLLVHAFREALS
ncbi:MAG: triphosphoribosyl-dephospho-CoA synthase [Gammaproteobacteria bacterium]|nr:triphosphoribosyl-dephospho-CoA synthase [Gammaproteobacteria bacterium]